MQRSPKLTLTTGLPHPGWTCIDVTTRGLQHLKHQEKQSFSVSFFGFSSSLMASPAADQPEEKEPESFHVPGEKPPTDSVSSKLPAPVSLIKKRRNKEELRSV